MKKQIKVSFFFTLASTLGLGIVYPVLLTGIGLFMPSLPHPPFPAQPVQRADVFQERPSMSGGPWSGASNLSLTNPKLERQVRERFKNFTKSFPLGTLPDARIPRELLFASASGHDPDLSVQGAMSQLLPLAKTHHLPVDTLAALVNQHTHRKLWGFIGSDTVNVVELNRALERLNTQHLLKKTIKD